MLTLMFPDKKNEPLTLKIGDFLKQTNDIITCFFLDLTNNQRNVLISLLEYYYKETRERGQNYDTSNIQLVVKVGLKSPIPNPHSFISNSGIDINLSPLNITMEDITGLIKKTNDLFNISNSPLPVQYFNKEQCISNTSNPNSGISAGEIHNLIEQIRNAFNTNAAEHNLEVYKINTPY